MPELPDVQVFKEYLDATALHKTIDRVRVRDSDLLTGVSVRRLRSALEGSQLRSTRRHGKYLFAEARDAWLVLHFGMTGFLKYYKRSHDEPEHGRLVLDLENGYHLAYDCQRKLGRISLTRDVESFVAGQELGPDPLRPDFDLTTFRRIMQGRRGMVKTTLMNQGTLAGIGNIYCDEILFQTGVHPETRVSELSEEEIRELHRTMRRVLRTAVDRRVDVASFPDSWLTPRREPGARCPRCGGSIDRIEVGGRSTYHCLDHQNDGSGPAGRRGAS